MRSVVIIIAIGILAGCAPSTEPEPKPEKSTAQLAIEGVTGKAAVDAGKRARNKIEEISANHEAELNEVLGE